MHTSTERDELKSYRQGTLNSGLKGKKLSKKQKTTYYQQILSGSGVIYYKVT